MSSRFSACSERGNSRCVYGHQWHFPLHEAFFLSLIQTNQTISPARPITTCCFKMKKGGIISKIRRRLTVQGDSENIDGAAASLRQNIVKEPEATEDVSFLLFNFVLNCVVSLVLMFCCITFFLFYIRLLYFYMIL